jgi:hypothetical protein
VTSIADPEMDVITVFDPEGTFRAEGKCEGMDTWHYIGRWAVEGNKLLWDIDESDMPYPFDDDMDDIVISITRDEMVTQDAEGKVTTYRKTASGHGQKVHEPPEKVVRLVARHGDKLGG